MNYKYLDFARELNNLCNIRVMVIRIVVGAVGTVNKRLGGWTCGIENQWDNRDQTNYSMAEIDYNT